MRTLLTTGLVLLASVSFAKDVKLNGRSFTIPDGFKLEVAATLPLTERPIHIDLDEQGRLYVGESSGSNENVRLQLEKKPHSILRLEDSDNDGVFDKRTVFAKDMMLPEGALWYDGSFYVGAPPQIWKITDIDDDGVADKREVWFDGKTLNGCANDLHGPYLGPDGWIYWCKGAFEKQTYDRPGKDPLVTRAAHIFRRRPEGGPVEAVMTGGMDNPVEMAFSAGGERFFTTTFLHHPHDDKRDGVIHAIYGGVYGKNHGVLDGHTRTGELMPELINMGAAAPVGMTRIQSSALGDGFKDSLLVCAFNKHKVYRHVLTPKGASFETREIPFLSSPDLDFHPTDVLEDADGSVLIVDTGGWYKLCCPTSQFWKPDIPGAIYRLSRDAAVKQKDPRGLAIDWPNATPSQLASLVIDARHVVKERAKRQLTKLDSAAKQQEAITKLTSLMSTANEADRIDIVWAFSRIDHKLAHEAVRKSLSDTAQVVRNAAAHVASVWRDQGAIKQLHKMLSISIADRRVAAEALGRIGSTQSVIPLLTAARGIADRTTEHSLIYALIEIGAIEDTRIGIPNSDSQTQRVQLIALDQMQGGGVDAKSVIGLLDSKSEKLVETAWWLIERHEEWVTDITGWFKHQLANETAVVSSSSFPARLALFANNNRIQSLMAAALREGSNPTKLAILKAIQTRIGITPSKPLLKELTLLLETKSSDVLAETVTTARSVATKLTPELIERITKIASDTSQTDLLRVQSLSTSAIGREKAKLGRLNLDSKTMAYVCDLLSLQQSARIRALAVDVLFATELNRENLAVIAAALPTTGPMELRRLLGVFERIPDGISGALLVSALAKSPAATTFDPKLLSARLAKFGPAVVASAKPVLDHITQQNKAKLTRMDVILAKLKDADERRGQVVFHATKTSCIACHQKGYLGGRIGPSLNRIGNIRSERDLLESVLFPSASFVRSFEPVSIVTKKGKTYNGTVRRETASEIVLALDAEKTIYIPIDQVEDRHTGTVSIMPAGLEKHLSDQDLADLIYYLKVSQ
jgi:putative membrane-bound dehydrogenase-like protein